MEEMRETFVFSFECVLRRELSYLNKKDHRKQTAFKNVLMEQCEEGNLYGFPLIISYVCGICRYIECLLEQKNFSGNITS